MHEERAEPASDPLPQPAESLEISANELSEQPAEDQSPTHIGPKFCGRCGAPWTPGRYQCGACGRILQVDGSLAAAPLAPAIPDFAELEEEHRTREQVLAGNSLALAAAFKLYFSLLAVCIALLAAGLADPELPIGWQISADILVAAVSLWFAGARPADVLPYCRVLVGPQWYLIAVGSSVGTYFMASLVVFVMTQLTGLPEVLYCDRYEQAGFGLAWQVLFICVMPAVFEEIAFRGVILEAMRGFLTRGEAVLVSALLFAILHLSVPSIPHLCVMGMILAQLRLASRSLLPGMVLHFTHNLLVVLAERNGNGILPW